MATARKYGWTPDAPDQRDFHGRYTAKMAHITLPPVFDLRDSCPKVYDQGQLGSCTANAVAGALHFTAMERLASASGANNIPIPARLFIYYWTRYMEGNASRDSGATLRGTMKSVARYGYPNEVMWPYLVDKFKLRPTRLVLEAAAKRLLAATYYARVEQTERGIKSAVASGNPVVFGFSVYESFESASVARTGMVPMPTAHERILGGHAMLIVGYDDRQACFIVRNSWGAKWGAAGYCLMPYQFLTDKGFASDFWTVSQVTGDATS